MKQKPKSLKKISKTDQKLKVKRKANKEELNKEIFEFINYLSDLIFFESDKKYVNIQLSIRNYNNKIELVPLISYNYKLHTYAINYFIFGIGNNISEALKNLREQVSLIKFFPKYKIIDDSLYKIEKVI